MPQKKKYKSIEKMSTKEWNALIDTAQQPLVNELRRRLGHQIDVSSPSVVQIVVRQDGKVVWVNVDGVCKLRACKIQNLTIEDQRKQ